MTSDRSGTRPRNLRIRFWLDAILGVISAALLLLSLLMPDWIEAVFGIEPDEGNGSLEWAIAGALLAGTIAASALARIEWRRPVAGRSHGSPETGG
jgi:hypothetical protein